jgi:hypothetical protein
LVAQVAVVSKLKEKLTFPFPHTNAKVHARRFPRSHVSDRIAGSIASPGGRRVEDGGGPVVVTWHGAGIGVVVVWNDERDHGSK